MDFGAFLDFMLAWDNRSSWAGIQYFFPVLDLQGRGHLRQVTVLSSCTMMSYWRSSYLFWPGTYWACHNSSPVSQYDIRWVTSLN